MCTATIPSHCCCFVFVATHSLSNPTNTTQPLQVPQFTSTSAWEQQRVYLPSEKPAHVPGYHDSSLQVSSACSWQIVVLIVEVARSFTLCSLYYFVFSAFTECWYQSVNLSGYEPLCCILKDNLPLQ